MSDLVTVSNGSQFFRVPAGQLAKARAEGFYRPAEKGLTIISDGRQILEISVRDLDAAQADGFRDVLARENPSVKSRSKPPDAAQQQGITDYRKAELEREALHEQLEQNVRDSSLLGRLPAMARLVWFEQREAVVRQARTSGLSIALHVALLLLLSTIFLADKQFAKPDIITVSTSIEDSIEEVVIEQVEIEVTEPVDEVIEEVSESMEVLAEVTEQFVSIDVSDSMDGSMLSPPAASDGDGDSMETPTKAKVQFFGSKTEAIDFVFVIDNSNSMTKGRFETALNELVKAVSKLNKRQKFYVIFYSDTAYPLFHPYSPKTLVPATPQNKQCHLYLITQ